MNKGIGGHNIFTEGGTGPSFISAHTAARLLDNEDPSCRVPWFETLFPETIKFLLPTRKLSLTITGATTVNTVLADTTSNSNTVLFAVPI